VNTHLYRHYDSAGRLLYVGISLSAVQRLAQHRDHSHWFEDIANVAIERHESREQALAAERAAIIKEQPLCNLQRPKKNHLKKERRQSPAEKSAQDLTSRIVQFNPMYSMAEVANALGVGVTAVKRWIENGQLSSVVVSGNRHKITGWQLIEFLEHAQNSKNL